MIRLGRLALLCIVVLMAGCSTPTKQASNGITHGKHYPIMEVLPDSIEGFSYVGSATYPQPWGYSLRYRSGASRWTHSDIYIYPAPKADKPQSHQELVVGMTRQALEEIDYAKQRGAYSSFQILDQRKFTLNGKMATRIDMVLVKDNLVSYSLLYVTESQGKLLKVRMTMPDNEANRNNARWQRFAETVFNTIMANMDKA